MSTFCGFDLDRVPALKKALTEVPGAAAGQSRAVGVTVENAYSALARGNGVSPRNLGLDDGSQGTDSDRSGFTAPSRDAADVAADIGRRLAHLLACQKLQEDGYTIDPSRVFDDEPAPSEQKIKAALAQAKTLIDRDSQWNNTDDVNDLKNKLVGLTAAEAEAVVGQLSDPDLKALNEAFTERHIGIVDISQGLDNNGRIAIANALYPGLSTDQLHRFASAMTSLAPALGGTDGSGNQDQNGIHYQWSNGQLFIDGKAAPSEIQQGDLGDCWFLAGLGAEQQVNPNFAQQHIRDNGNGTYTVTLYQDGKPTPITVDGQLPYNNWNPPQTSFEHSPSGASWVQIYEKAYAQSHGGYANIEGGYGNVSMHDLSGKSSNRVDPDDTSLNDIRSKLDSGVPVTVGTNSHHSGFLWLHSDETFDNHKLVTSHEYIVQSVNNSVDPPTITLRNPWGQGANPPETVTLTQDEFNGHINDVDFGG